MKTFPKVVRCVVFGATLAASAMHAQEEKKKPSEDKPAPHVQHTAPAPREHTAPPPADRHAAPAVQQSAPPPPHRDAAPPERQHTPAQDRPAQTPQMRQAQPNGVPPNRNPQPSSGAQPGRTFGNQPDARPGRQFGNNAPGRTAEPPRGQTQMSAPRTYTTRTGDVIHRDSNGQVRQVHMTDGTVVYHPPNAPRRVEMVRPGGRVVVASAPGHGYVQRSVTISNTTIIKRTYIYNGVPQARIYRPQVFNGVTLAIYTPVRYYRPGFYVYAYNPWPRPIFYGFGWGGQPWYGYYGGYFTPFPSYASPSLWLTDYLIAATLEAAYQERMDARMAARNNYMDGGQSAPMSPEVKQAIADEVRRQIDRERAEGQMAGGQDNMNTFADNGPHVFVVHAAFAVNSNAGECSIGEGDVLQMNGAPPSNSPYAELTVLSSRGQDCRKGSTVSVSLQDLQEMQNQMRATIDRGMGDLQAKQGQGGLPPLPQGSTGTIDSPFVQEAQPDANAASELTSVSREADLAERQAVGQSGGEGPVPTLSLGLTLDEVKAIQGDPQKIVDLGSKKIYMYKDLKITFIDGKVSDIQ